MIISRIWAGLGNQLFQYAAGKCLAALHNTTFKIDRRWYGLSIPGETAREYQLDSFNLAVETVSKSDLAAFPYTSIPRLKLGRSFLPRWQLFMQKRKQHFDLRSYRELHFHFDPKYFDLSSHVYLVGYFQSERYFKPIEKTIREEFTFKLPPESENKRVLEQIESKNSVSLHVRRGDYALIKRVNQHHGLCDLGYYKKAIQEMEKRVSNPHYYVFSDDIPWVRSHLSLGEKASYIAHNQGSKSIEDLRLMSHCNHHIIANSSFSWWGAWLNPRGDKIVIAPQKWTNVGLNISDLVPPDWILL